MNDADAVYASAKAAGAKIAMDIKNEDYGGRGFSCLDLEGHLWNFGTYDPRQSAAGALCTQGDTDLSAPNR